MGRQLTATVYLQDEDDNTVSFGPGDVVPEWAAAKITNPDVWSDGGEAAEAPAASVPDGPTSPSVDAPDPAEAEQVAADVDVLRHAEDVDVAKLLEEASIKRISAALDGLDDDERPAIMAVLAGMEHDRGEKARVGLLEKLDATGQ